MPKTFLIKLDNQVFSITAPSPPSDEFVRHQPTIALRDDSLFAKSDSVTALRVHWKFHAKALQKVSGVLELQAMVRAARETDITSDEALRKQLLAYFRRELAKIGHSESSMRFDEVTINGRSWLRYQVPVVGATEYSTVLSRTKYLTIQFAFIDNTGETSPSWFEEAKELMRRLVDSTTLE